VPTGDQGEFSNGCPRSTLSDHVCPMANDGHVESLPTLAASVRPVRKAYEQAADQLRELIVTGRMAPGTRLPSELVLARDFGISRTTVREALRLLAAQSLIRTAKGPTGGSFVTLPTVDHISEFLQASIGLLTETRSVSLEEFLEARELLECRAVRLAAENRTDGDVARLRATIPESPLELTVDEQFVHNRDFHSVVLESCGNTLLRIAALPLFSVLQTNLARSALGREFHTSINDHHQRIADAVAAGDPDLAEQEMGDHLAYLRPAYERAWTHARTPGEVVAR
jgi:DNA-binding FadR family transcriptional regulator